MAEPVAIESPYELGGNAHQDYKLGGSHGITRIQTSDTHVTMGDMTFERAAFVRAFEGSFQTGYAPAPSRKFANPVPFGVATFAVSLFCLSLVNMGLRGTSNAAALAGLCWFCAGLTELLAGMWLIAVENTWAATLLASFSAFWMGYGCIVTDVFGIIEANGASTPSVLGIWVLAWSLFVTMMWIPTLKSTYPLCMLVGFVVVALHALSASNFVSTAHPTIAANLTKVGGYFGLFAALLAYYVVYEGLCTKENSYFVPPVLLLPGAITSAKAAEE